MTAWYPRLLSLGFALVAGLAVVCSTQAQVPKPEIPAAQGEQCVEPVPVMRRDHMKFILHQRDETVHGGIRGARHSLVDCIDCHVQPRKAGEEAPRASEPQHFCTSCHVYAGVRVDCFECHADRPARSDYKHRLSGTRHHVTDKPVTARDLELLVTQGETP